MKSAQSGLIAPAVLAAACAAAPASDSAATRFVDAAGVRTHVGQWGEGDPLLLIHGASSDMAVFAPTVIPLLQGRHLVTAYDRPGMGFTAERPANAHALEVQAKVAAGVIEAIGLRKPVVIAHSFGGAVALRLALDRPDLISGLVLIAPVAYEWPGGVAWHAYVSANPVLGPLFNYVVAQPFAQSAARSGVKGSFAPAEAPDDYVEDAAVLRAVRPAAMGASARDLVALKKEVIGQQDRYAGIALPVAILAGDGDTVVSTTIHARKLEATLSSVRLDVLANVGHMPHEAAPDRLAALVDWVWSESRN